MMQRPGPDEYAPYASHYVNMVPDGSFETLLQLNTDDVVSAFGSIPFEKHDHAYAQGKWTVKQLLMHLIDTERVFAYRARVVSRGDMSPLPSFDENEYAAKAQVAHRSMRDLLDEFVTVRNSTISLFDHMSDAESMLLGNGPAHVVSARALGYMIIGHARHHLAILKERY